MFLKIKRKSFVKMITYFSVYLCTANVIGSFWRKYYWVLVLQLCMHCLFLLENVTDTHSLLLMSFFSLREWVINLNENDILCTYILHNKAVYMFVWFYAIFRMNGWRRMGRHLTSTQTKINNSNSKIALD